MSAIVHQDLIDASELDSLLQRLTTAQNDKERLRHLKTAARNYTFDGGQIARLLAPMAASPAAAVEAAVMLLRRAVPRAADPAAVETAVAALVYDEQRADVKARLGLGPGDITDAAAPLAVSSTAVTMVLRSSMVTIEALRSMLVTGRVRMTAIALHRRCVGASGGDARSWRQTLGEEI